MPTARKSPESIRAQLLRVARRLNRLPRCRICFDTGWLAGRLGKRLRCSACTGNDLVPESKALGVPELLESMAATFRERNAVYGDNWRMVGRLMMEMFPRGIRVESAAEFDVWHLFELMIVKLSRFAVSGLSHQDSILDLGVYAAMITAILKQQEKQACPKPSRRKRK